MDFDSPSYQEFIEAAARKCRSCPVCSEVPCDACMAGGVCDQFCSCLDDYDSYYHDVPEDD